MRRSGVLRSASLSATAKGVFGPSGAWDTAAGRAATTGRRGAAHPGRLGAPHPGRPTPAPEIGELPADGH